MIERDFFNAEQLRPINQLGACLDAWIEGLESLLTQQQAATSPRINAIVTDILTQIKQALESLQGRLPALSWNSGDVTPLISEVLDAHWSRLAEALLHEGSLGSIKTTLRVFALRKQSLEALTALAWQRRTVSEQAAPGRGTEPSNGGAKAESLFSTPLCLSLDSANALDAVTARDLRQSLIKPVLFATVLSVREVKPELADVKPVEDRLAGSLAQLSGEMKRFLRDIETHGWDLFHNGFTEHQATNDHPYYRSICEIWRLAEPKIDLSKSRKFAPPLDVTVVQQVANSCVPQLLTHNCEVSLREANVDENSGTHRGMGPGAAPALRLLPRSHHAVPEIRGGHRRVRPAHGLRVLRSLAGQELVSLLSKRPGGMAQPDRLAEGHDGAQDLRGQCGQGRLAPQTARIDERPAAPADAAADGPAGVHSHGGTARRDGFADRSAAPRSAARRCQRRPAGTRSQRGPDGSADPQSRRMRGGPGRWRAARPSGKCSRVATGICSGSAWISWRQRGEIVRGTPCSERRVRTRARRRRSQESDGSDADVVCRGRRVRPGDAGGVFPPGAEPDRSHPAARLDWCWRTPRVRGCSLCDWPWASALRCRKPAAAPRERSEFIGGDDEKLAALLSSLVRRLRVD